MTWLKHPLVVALATALFAGVGANFVVRTWQNHDKQLDLQRVRAERELELKGDVVGRIGAASAGFLGTAAAGGELSASYREFQVRQAEVGSQLAAYFPRPVGTTWNDYAFTLRNVYYLLTTPPGNGRSFWLAHVSGYLRIKPITIDGLCFPSTKDVYGGALRTLVLLLQKKEADIVNGVVRSGSVLTHPKAALLGAGPLPDVDPRACARYFGSS